MMMLSPHFTLAEFVRSDYAIRNGIDNTPLPQVLEKLQRTAAGLERIRLLLGCRIFISSGYRCPELNARIGGAKTSQHVKGEAVDFTAPAFGSPRMICQEIVKHADTIDYDQLIFEGAWVHASFSDNPRRQVLTAHFPGPHYSEGIA